ncbi:hypothetical protein ABT144_30040 [Streptomyces sp. NPDC002039]|uniref:hypothetical protein n=1 Tax=Streptomyces sp. NPDC002039 TaxID=3154660 RepID=UPI0033278282
MWADGADATTAITPRSEASANVPLALLLRGYAYDGLACLFGIRSSSGFRPLAEGRGFPNDASPGVRGEFAACGGPGYVHGTTWLTCADLNAADWQATHASGTRSHASAAGVHSDWGQVWNVMRALSDLHGAQNVRLVVWFH